MTNKGKHSSDVAGTFYRDLAIMILGIVLVGAAVFFLLYLFADAPETGPTTTTTTVATTSSSQAVTSSTGDATTSTTPSTSTSGVEVRPPGDVTVVVLNSMGLDGAAGRMTSRLSEGGYQTMTPDDYEPELDPSRIWYREGFAAEAAILVEYIPSATVEELPDGSIQEGADVILVLGTGYEE